MRRNLPTKTSDVYSVQNFILSWTSIETVYPNQSKNFGVVIFRTLFYDKLASLASGGPDIANLIIN